MNVDDRDGSNYGCGAGTEGFLKRFIFEAFRQFIKDFYQQNKLYKGPCEHMLALRMQHRRSLAGSAS